MMPPSITFIDLETTGGHVARSQIIEIGIIRTEKGKIVKKYSQLVRPVSSISPFVLELTGITYEELDRAPIFEAICGEVLEMIKDSVIAAHNIRFDYGILHQEFKRCGISFSSKHFCTIKLSKLLYPGLRFYNLDHLISNFHLKIEKRHRAFDDAKVIWDLYSFSRKNTARKIFEKALNLALKEPSVPLNITGDELESLPESPGVYIFYGDHETPLYVGKSINIKDRVKSHFSRDYLSSKDLNISREIRRIGYERTAGELGALFLESSLIKKLQPIYNRRLRLRRKLIAVTKCVNADGIYVFKIEEKSGGNGNFQDLLSIFRSQSQAKEFLYSLAGEYDLCPKLLGLENTTGACFWYRLNRCRGICAKKEDKLKYNLRFMDAFTKYRVKPWPFAGPILVREESELKESFLFDRWCLLDSFSSEEDMPVPGKYEYIFDYDAYKILHRFLSSGTNLRKVTNLKTFQVG
ncbi:MAG: polymerase III subunit epsilon, DNA polymerase III subunit epsilon protein [Candidatus Gottesmanbacteria bacterium GW2011_GWA2_43_14]|uniref:Polymerase III subunit epsilon, DNA polymerase III subunit epsilon protein n=1 Tax=Candidatus Gottesmanbacteria bacterium GW2011_GWA2_43_14 TaxID=1618443 RepID=A0A0G1DLC7_9BACT|nr:MAG: polymerase III subunit epsilon, DNA polymerase III subunit epsilon protein [Candidatus Gottesmanbacteria bacterium GW2011_GWA2_43_14]